MTGDSRVSPPATAYLRALTAEARYALGDDLVPLTRWPYRVGRESRQKTMLHIASPADDRRTGEALRTNELYLPEQASESVSREHFEIERTDSGFHLRDRQSLSGTWVEGRLVGGGRKGGTEALHHSDVIIVGPVRGGFVFKFLCDAASGSVDPPTDSVSAVLAEVQLLREEVAALTRRLDLRT